jgi:thiamine monophosphate synthase
MILLAITPGLGVNRGPWQAVLHSGIDAFLIRERHLSARGLLDAVRWCQDTAPGVALWVAGRLDVALAAGCGLHAPEAHPEIDAGLVKLSRPLHHEDQWTTRNHADQLLISPIFPSPGKGGPWGAERLLCFLDGRQVGGPRLLALGGVDSSNVRLLRHTRLAGIAAIRPFWDQDPRRAVAGLRG